MNLSQWVPFGAAAFFGLILFRFYKNGWDDLAVYYLFRGTFPKDIIKRDPADLSFIADAGIVLWKGKSSTNFPIKIAADQKGLYLYDIFFGRFFHPPLFIPWGDLTVSRREIPKFLEKIIPSKTLSLVSIIFKIKRTPNITLEISAFMAKKIEENSQGVWSEVSRIETL